MFPTISSRPSSLASATSLALAALLWAAPGAAQSLPPPETVEAPCAPDLEAPRRAQLAHGGIPGLWFHGDLARCMLGRLELLPAYARHVRLLEERAALAEQRDALRAREVELAEQEAAAAVSALEAAVRRAREAEAERDAWWRHPALWAAVGAVVVVALEVVAVYLLSSIP